MFAARPLPTILVPLLLLCALLGCRSDEPEVLLPDVDRTLVVGCDLDNPPFAALDAEGAPVGRDVDMMLRLGTRIRRPIEWRRAPFEQLLDLLERGEVDVVCATLGVTPEREQRVLFTRPYYETEIAVVVRADDDAPRTFSDLSGRRVGAGVGTTSERAVRTLLPSALCVPATEEGATTAELLLAGALDAAAMDAPNADALVAASGGELARMAKGLAPERYAIAVSRQRPALRERLSAILDAMDREGALRELDEDYGL